jgi:hypothetical protein
VSEVPSLDRQQVVVPFPSARRAFDVEKLLGDEQNARQLFLTAYLALHVLERRRAGGTATPLMFAQGVALAHAALGRLLARTSLSAEER